MTKQLEVLRSKEDQELVVAYKGIDLDDYEYITVAEYDLDYSSYDVPDAMWSDFLAASEVDR